MKDRGFRWLLMAFLFATMTAIARPARIELSVAAYDNTPIAVEVYGVESHPKALIVVLPGTGGQTDPYFDAEVTRDAYDPDHRGGLTETLLSANYAIAFVGHRGYRTGAHCVPDVPLPQRIDQLVTACIDGATRATVNLTTITQDTAAVLTRLKKTYRLPVIVMAYSEGGYHIAKIIHDGTFVPDGLVLIGTPLQSVSEVFQYQISREFVFNLAHRALEKCPANTLSIADAFSCAGIEETPERREQLLAFLAQDHVTPQAVTMRRAAHRNFSNDLVARFAGPERPMTLSGVWLGRQMPIAWAGSFYTEAFASTTPISALLADYRKPVALFYGELDDLVPHEGATLCRHAPTSCVRPEIIPRGDHALGAADHLPLPDTLNRLRKALDAALGR
jgi:alpha-beta hydrolase superfamily lysophospholipase